MHEVLPLNAEHSTRWILIGLALGVLLAIFLVRSFGSGQAIEVHAKMPEQGGWTPSDLAATAGQPLHLRLTSDDVLHGFAIGQSDQSPVDVEPGKMTELTLNFDQPGKYTYYCTRWCGPNHWRMRGTIEVQPDLNKPGAAASQSSQPEAEPLFIQMGVDIDGQPHTDRIPPDRPNARRGQALDTSLPEKYLAEEYYRTHSPVEVWESLRNEAFTQSYSDQQVWDLVAWVWRQGTSPAKLAEGQMLFAQNCAACHGEMGAGDGVMAEAVAAEYASSGHGPAGPIDFTDPHRNLATSPVIQQGKIIRGGMGTGMPYWGPIFTEEQIWALVDYLWTFQFEY